MKTCSKCKIKKDVSLFSSNKRNKDLLDCYCKDCKKIIREEKREQNKSFSKKYYEANKGKWTEYRKSNADNIRLNAIMPLAKGGPNNKDNIQLLCPPCNRLKSDKHPVEFMQKKGFLL